MYEFKEAIAEEGKYDEDSDQIISALQKQCLQENSKDSTSDNLDIVLKENLYSEEISAKSIINKLGSDNE